MQQTTHDREATLEAEQSTSGMSGVLTGVGDKKVLPALLPNLPREVCV